MGTSYNPKIVTDRLVFNFNFVYNIIEKSF
jgi:hypothetical protein